MKKLEYTEKRHLECVLTAAEVKAYGEDLAHRLMDIGKLEADKSVLTAKIKPIQKDVEALVVKIDTGKEVREVDCDWHYDWDNGKKKLFRSDTYDEVPHTTYDITEEEKQLELKARGE